jgi:Arc/MetJ family transcription regulator
MKTLIDLDEELLAQAKEILQTSTKKDTVNAALAEVIALAGRRALIAHLAAGGCADLHNEEVMAAAWRR